MRYMNDFDLIHAQQRFARAACPRRLGVAQVVARLANWADDHSDGWHSWPAPCRAASVAISHIESRTSRENDEQERVDLTDDEVRRALAPIKAFLTRQKVSDEERAYVLVGPMFEIGNRYIA